MDEYSSHSNNNSDPHHISETSSSAARPKKRSGRKKFNETRHPEYRGVRRRNAGKWVCELREPATQKRVWLGTYPTPEMAARAHDVGALALRGEAARLNFADSAWRLPVPASNDPEELRKTAAEAARAFRTREEEEGEGYDQGVRSNGGDFVRPELSDVSCDEWSVTALAEEVMMSPPPCLGWRFCWDDEVRSDGSEVVLWSF